MELTAVMLESVRAEFRMYIVLQVFVSIFTIVFMWRCLRDFSQGEKFAPTLACLIAIGWACFIAACGYKNHIIVRWSAGQMEEQLQNPSANYQAFWNKEHSRHPAVIGVLDVGMFLPIIVMFVVALHQTSTLGLRLFGSYVTGMTMVFGGSIFMIFLANHWGKGG